MISIPEAIVSGTPILTNRIPALANYINKNKVGIAKEQWDHKDMEQFVKKQHLYSAWASFVHFHLTNFAQNLTVQSIIGIIV